MGFIIIAAEPGGATPDEQRRMYQVQCGLRMQKRCTECGRMLPVEVFDRFGAQPCRECWENSERCACGTWKQAHLPRCYSCQRKFRVEAAVA